MTSLSRITLQQPLDNFERRCGEMENKISVKAAYAASLPSNYLVV